MCRFAALNFFSHFFPPVFFPSLFPTSNQFHFVVTVLVSVQKVNVVQVRVLWMSVCVLLLFFAIGSCVNFLDLFRNCIESLFAVHACSFRFDSIRASERNVSDLVDRSPIPLRLLWFHPSPLSSSLSVFSPVCADVSKNGMPNCRAYSSASALGTAR